MVAELPQGSPFLRSASDHVVTFMIRRGCYQPKQ